MRMQRRWQCFEIPGPFRGFLKEAPCWELGSSEAGWGRCGGQGRRQPHSWTAPSSQTRLCLGAAASSPEEKATTNNYTSFSRLGCSGGSGLLTSCFGGCRGGSACWSCFCQESQQTPSKGRYPACGGRAIPQSLTRRWELQAAARPGLTIPGWDRPGPALRAGEIAAEPLPAGHPLPSASGEEEEVEIPCLGCCLELHLQHWWGKCRSSCAEAINSQLRESDPAWGRIQPAACQKGLRERAWGSRQVCGTTRYFWPAQKCRLSLQIKGSPSAGLPCQAAPPLAQLPHLGNLDNNICPWELHHLEPLAKIIKPSERKGMCLVRFPIKIFPPSPTFYWWKTTWIENETPGKEKEPHGI